MHKSGYAIVVTGLLTVLMTSYSVSHAGQSETLADAVIRGDLERVQQLLDKGADVNAKDKKGKTTLILAASIGQLSVTKLLLDKGADVNAKDDYEETALMNAAWRGHLEVVRLLLDRGADVNARKKRGLVALKFSKIVRLLLDRGADVNDLTALTLTACNGDRRRLEVVRLLKDRGAEMTLADASCLGDLEEVQRLIRKGSDVNARDFWGMSPLMRAAAKGNLEIVKLLLDKGADINAKTKKIGPALTLALDNGHLEVARLLILKGADVNPRMHPLYRRNPLEIARTKGYKEIEELLRAHRAKE